MSVEMRATTRFEEDDIALIETSPVGRDDSHVVGVVILVHGLGGQKSSESHLAAIQMLSDRGFATIRFDFPGHGESGGTTEALTIAKGARLIDHITNIAASRYVGQPISLLGASFGATCILASSAVERATAIVLRSPVSDYQGVRLRQLGLEGLARWEREGLIDGLISGNRRSPWAFYLEAGQINLFASATERYARMLIVQGQEDDTVPISDSLRLSKAWAGRSDVVVIKGGDHSLTDLVHMGIYIALACHWIAS